MPSSRAMGTCSRSTLRSTREYSSWSEQTLSQPRSSARVWARAAYQAGVSLNPM